MKKDILFLCQFFYPEYISSAVLPFDTCLLYTSFAGFIAVYEEGRDDDGEAMGSPLPDLASGDKAAAAKTEKAQHFTQPPARYTCLLYTS